MPNKKKVVLAVGGTGGHLFPAQGFARELQKKDSHIELLFVGQGLSTNAYFDKEQFSFCDVNSVTPFKGNVFKAFRAISILCSGILASIKLLSKEKPQLVVGFGSFHAFPVLLAALLKRIPILLFESNAIPGKVIRIFSKRALFTAIYMADAKKYLKGRTVEVEIPTAHLLEKTRMTKEAAKEHLSLDPDVFTLLVFGGSQGARQINLTILEMLPLLPIKFQLIHFTGDEALATQIQERCTQLKISCYVKKFEKQMQIAWSAADLVICRSGAMTVSELLHYEVPGILIPYPLASEEHQLKNALFLENTVKGAVHLVQGALNPTILAEWVLSFTHSDFLKRNTMQNLIRSFNEKKQKTDLTTMVARILEE